MKIVSCYTPNLRPLVGPLRESLEKYAPDHLIIEHEPEQVKTFSLSWPANRFFYCTAQGGEFLDLAKFKDEPICLIDADTVMQRSFTPEEEIAFTPMPGEFIINLCSYPPRTLNEMAESLLCRREVVSRDNFIEFSAAMLIANRADWERLRDIYIPFFKSLRRSMFHHATTQWLICHLLQWKFKVRFAPDHLHNAGWYIGTRARADGKFLKVDGERVIFNHTKFAGQ